MVLAAVEPDEMPDALAQRLRDNFQASNSSSNRAYDLSISVGLTHIDARETRSMNELMARADRLMYQDKRLKRSRDVLTPDFIRPRLDAVA